MPCVWKLSTMTQANVKWLTCFFFLLHQPTSQRTWTYDPIQTDTQTHTHTHIDSMHNGCHGHDLLFSLLRLHCRSLTLRSSDWHAFGWLSSHTYTLDPPPHILTHTPRCTALHVRALCLIPSQLWVCVWAQAREDYAGRDDGRGREGGVGSREREREIHLPFLVLKH